MFTVIKMKNTDFEKAFETLLEGQHYDDASAALFAAVRAAFLAGYDAGRASILSTAKVLELRRDVQEDEYPPNSGNTAITNPEGQSQNTEF